MFSKGKYILAGLLITGLASFSQTVKFAGTADEKYNGSKVILYNRATGDHDSATLKDGRFELNVSYKEPSVYYFYSQYEMKTKGGYTPFGIMVTEPGTVNIEASMENFTASRVKGAKEYDLYSAYNKKSGDAHK